MSKALLEIKRLSCGYGDKTILRDISLAVDTQEIVTIIGPNGSGKTTLLRAVSRILAPREGKVLLSGVDINKMTPEKLARQIAVVGQFREPVAMTVREYVLLGRIPFYTRFQFIETDRDRALADRYIRLTGIAECENKRLNELSGGQMQLAAIARALAQEPKLLLLDEPTAHLDITHQTRILDLIRRLNRELSITVLMVLHDLNLASEYSHRLMLLKEGQQVACGKPGQVLTYKAVEEVYDTTVLVDKNPLSGRPHVFLVTEEQQRVSGKLGVGRQASGVRPNTQPKA